MNDKAAVDASAVMASRRPINKSNKGITSGSLAFN
jgi:hypothetical protein